MPGTEDKARGGKPQVEKSGVEKSGAEKSGVGKPGGEESGSGEAFLSRWARRKEAQRRATAPAGQVPAEAGAPDQAESAEDAEPPLRVEDLPDIDSLDEGSDFTVFLKEGVPASLRRRALRKLWRLNPVFANLDGLAEYDEDYHTLVDLPGGVKTLFQAGKGMVQPEDEAKPEAGEGLDAAEEAPETPPGTPPETPAESPVAEAETERPAGLPEGSAGPLPGDPAPDPQAADAPPLPAKPARPSPTARGSAVKRRWGGFEG